MKDIIRGNRIRDILTASLISLAILFIGQNIFSLVMCIYITPQIVVGHRHGFKYGLFSLLLALGVLAAGFGLKSIYLVLIFGLVGYFFIVGGLKYKFSATRTVFLTTLALIAVLGGYFYLLQSQMEADIFANAAENIKKMVELYVSSLDQSGNGEQIGKLNSLIDIFAGYIMVGLPGILAEIAFFCALLNYMISTYVLRRMGLGNLETSKFKEFSLPKNFGVGMILTMLATWILGFFDFPYQEEVLFNLLIIYIFLLGIQGLAMQDYFLVKGNRRIVRILLPLLIIVTLNAFYVYSFIGLVDVFFDFRLKDKRKGTGGK